MLLSAEYFTISDNIVNAVLAIDSLNSIIGSGGNKKEISFIYFFIKTLYSIHL